MSDIFYYSSLALKALKQHGILGFFVILCFSFLYVLIDESRTRQMRSIYWWLLSWSGVKASKNFIQSNIDTNFYSFRKRLTEISSDLLPYDIKLEWVNSGEPEAFINSNDVVIRLKPQTNQNENIAKVALFYISNSLIPKTRKHLSLELRRAIDLFVTHSLLVEQDSKGAATSFFENTWEPEIKKDKLLNSYVEGICDIEEKGNFNSLLLREYATVGSKVAIKPPTKIIQEELVRFYTFVYNISNRHEGQLSNLKFKGIYLKVGVILVAKPETYSRYGFAPYYERLRRYIYEGYETIYLLASGLNIKYAQSVALNFCKSYPVRIIGQETSLITRHGQEQKAISIALFIDHSKITEDFAENKWGITASSVVEGKIIGIQNNYITAEIYGHKFLVPADELAWIDFDHPSDIFKLHEIVKFKVLGFDEQSEPILSAKRAFQDPWEKVKEFAPISSLKSCDIRSIDDEGSYVIIENMYNGFIPKMHIDDRNMQNLKKWKAFSKKVNAEVISYNYDRRLIILSLSKVHEANLNKLKQKYPIGAEIDGVVSFVHDRYSIVSIEGKTIGFIHISELSWNWIDSANEVLTEGQNISAIVIGHDVATCRLDLSIKNILGNPWLELDLYKGMRLKGEIIEIRENGVVVELLLEESDFNPTGFLGKEFIDLKDDNVSLSDLFELGDSIDVSVQYINKETQKLILTRKELFTSIRNRILSRFENGQEVRATVVKRYPHGVLTDLVDNVRAFLAFKDIYGEIDNSKLMPGKTINCCISRIDYDNSRIQLFIPKHDEINP